MSPEDQASTLEAAIIERAETLVEEHLRQAESAHKRIIEDATEKLRLLEEREILSAKARADREYRRRVQAAEIRMQADVDRLRWALVQSVLQGMHARFEAIAGDAARYEPLLRRLLGHAAQNIERDELVAVLCEADHERFAGRWEAIAAETVPSKKIALSPVRGAFSGGVVVSSADGRIRVDNSLEGRVERLEAELHQVILERLFPRAMEMGAMFNG